MEIGKWVKAARDSRDWSQEELAHQLGRTKANISGWENGRHEPSFGQIMRIAELTGYPLADLAWPLPMVDAERYQRLDPEDRAYAQAKMMAAVEERERAHASSDREPAATDETNAGYKHPKRSPPSPQHHGKTASARARGGKK